MPTSYGHMARAMLACSPSELSSCLHSWIDWSSPAVQAEERVGPEQRCVMLVPIFLLSRTQTGTVCSAVSELRHTRDRCMSVIAAGYICACILVSNSFIHNKGRVCKNVVTFNFVAALSLSLHWETCMHALRSSRKFPFTMLFTQENSVKIISFKIKNFTQGSRTLNLIE